MTIVTVVAAALAVLAVGCACPVTHYTVAVTPSVTAEQEAVVRAAVAEWSAAVPELSFDVERREEYRAEAYVVWVSAVGDQCSDAECARGLNAHSSWGARAGAGQVNVTQRGFSTGVVAHELGHVMGLSHAECGVMRAVTRGDDTGAVSACDVEQYRAVWGG